MKGPGRARAIGSLESRVPGEGYREGFPPYSLKGLWVGGGARFAIRPGHPFRGHKMETKTSAKMTAKWMPLGLQNESGFGKISEKRAPRAGPEQVPGND